MTERDEPCPDEVRERYALGAATFKPARPYPEAHAEFDRMIEAVRAEERERCAQLADSVGHHWSGLPAKAAFEAAERIREQGKKGQS